MLGKLLVFVPHQDDELSIAGQVLPTFLEAGYACRICFSTNGDGFKSNGPVRLREAMKVADRLGVGRENLLFLGFDDSMGSDHPYNRVTEESKASAPLAKTYSEDVACYSALRSGMALPQCRETLIADIDHLLFTWRPDIVICIDYDSHPDHRALSLAFEEALGDVMRRDHTYRPLVLKKFAYPSVWYGPADYSTFAATVRPGKCGLFELDNPMYTWDERIRVAPHPSSITRLFFSNSIVKAAMRYPSQNGWFRMASVCNSDVVYWVRRTDNLVLEAEIESSSGSALALFDFPLFDSADVCSNSASTIVGHSFRFDGGDGDRFIRAAFDEPRRVAEVAVREAVGSFGTLANAVVSFDGGSACALMRAETHPGRLVLALKPPVVASKVELRFEKGAGAQEIASVEIYPDPLAGYAPLEAFKNLVGVPGDPKPSRFHPEGFLGQVARITRKLERMKLKWREKRYAKCQKR